MQGLFCILFNLLILLIQEAIQFFFINPKKTARTSCRPLLVPQESMHPITT